MLEAWELIRHVAEVLGMVFLPILGWMLLTLTQHSKKIILLEERVNETITHRLGILEENMDEIRQKIDDTTKVINSISMDTHQIKYSYENRDKKLDAIWDEVQKLSKNN